MERQDRVFAVFAKQVGEQDFPILGPQAHRRIVLKHESLAFQA
jgi:hypothetical protein